MKVCLLPWFSVVLIFTLPVFGDDTTDMLSKALDLVRQVENPTVKAPTDAQRIDLLTQAITMAQQAPNHRLKGHRVLAIQAIRSAIAEISAGDPNHQAATYLHTADTELSTSVSLDGSSPLSAPVQAPPTPPLSAGSPSVAVPDPTSTVAAVVPPDVTPDMEQAFLAKYKAASEKQDPDAFFALVALDSNMDSKAKDALKGLMTLGFLLDASNLNREYSFVPVPSGQPDEPTQLAGKMYNDYPPAKVELKITFKKNDQASSNGLVAQGPTILPLCIQDHHLMITGVKEIPGAVPPPAVDKAANFGVEPNLRKVNDKTTWENGNAFTSLNEFLSSLKQPSVEILASGESKFEYYAICRIAPNLCVWAGGDKVGEKNYSFYFRATDSNKQELKGSQKWIRLADVPTDNGQAPDVQGTVFFVPDHYAGPVTIDAQYSDGAGNKASSVSRTVEWKP